LARLTVRKTGRCLDAGASGIKIHTGQVEVAVVESGFKTGHFGTEPAGDVTIGVNGDTDLALLYDGMNFDRSEGVSMDAEVHLSVDLEFICNSAADPGASGAAGFAAAGAGAESSIWCAWGSNGAASEVAWAIAVDAGGAGAINVAEVSFPEPNTTGTACDGLADGGIQDGGTAFGRIAPLDFLLGAVVGDVVVNTGWGVEPGLGASGLARPGFVPLPASFVAAIGAEGAATLKFRAGFEVTSAVGDKTSLVAPLSELWPGV
jgi:hypothetical protein